MIFLMGINIIINENKILIFNNELNCKQFPDRIEVNDGEKNIILRISEEREIILPVTMNARYAKISHNTDFILKQK